MLFYISIEVLWVTSAFKTHCQCFTLDITQEAVNLRLLLGYNRNVRLKPEFGLDKEKERDSLGIRAILNEVDERY